MLYNIYISALKEKVYFYTHKFITKEFRGENWASFFKVLNTVKHREESQRWWAYHMLRENLRTEYFFDCTY
jgi:hypothetical protein